VDYWQTAAQQLLLDPDTPQGSTRASLFEIDFVAAGLLADHGLPAEPSRSFASLSSSRRKARKRVPLYQPADEPEPSGDALPVVENAIKAAPDNQQLQGLRNNLNDIKKSQGVKSAGQSMSFFAGVKKPSSLRSSVSSSVAVVFRFNAFWLRQFVSAELSIYVWDGLPGTAFNRASVRMPFQGSPRHNRLLPDSSNQPETSEYRSKYLTLLKRTGVTKRR